MINASGAGRSVARAGPGCSIDQRINLRAGIEQALLPIGFRPLDDMVAEFSRFRSLGIEEPALILDRMSSECDRLPRRQAIIQRWQRHISLSSGIRGAAAQKDLVQERARDRTRGG